MPFRPKEKIHKPRILLLDFEQEIFDKVKEKNFNVFLGNSGFNGKEQLLPIHPSEIELIFWNCANLKFLEDTISKSTAYPPNSHMRANSINSNYIGKLQPYFDALKSKSGFACLILGTETIDFKILNFVIPLLSISVYNRVTSTIFPEEQNNFIGKFLMRFINDENIKFSLSFVGGLRSYILNGFLYDEDRNYHALYIHKYLLVIPSIRNASDAILSLLQDFLPNELQAEIFPDKARFNWLNTEEYELPLVKEKRQAIEDLKLKYQTKVNDIEKAIELYAEKYKFLNKSLISDDTDIFKDEDKLSTQIKSALNFLDFSVEDADLKNKFEGKSLKEDLQLKTDDYFSLCEIKGTENGAKANWVKKDFEANRSIYSRVHDMKPSVVNGMTVFNHERRTDPRERSKPFESDPDLISYAKASGISLVPTYELYKLCREVIMNKITKNEARQLLISPGLFIYPNHQAKS